MNSQSYRLIFKTGEEHLVRNEGKGRTTVCDKQKSSLTAREQKKYLYLLQKYSNKVVSAPSEIERKAIQTLATLHAKVVAEQKKFIEYQKSNAKSYTEYNFVHPEAARYVKELVQKKLQSCLCYPRHYAIREKLSLLEDVAVDSSALPYLVCNLLELGRVPRLVSPDLDTCTIDCNYAKMCRRFPVTFPSESLEKHPSIQPINQDSIAKTLADKHSADVIMSFSSLKHLLNCRSLNSDTSWELPITIASFPSIDATDCSAKRVFIDKAIPAGIWRASRKSALYHKYGAKLQFTHFKLSKIRRKEQCFYQGAGEEKQHNREIVKLQDGFFETDNFVHETFGQISSSLEKKSAITEGCMESDTKTFDINHSTNEEDKFAQSLNNKKKHITVPDGGSFHNNAVNKSMKTELDKDKSDQHCNYLDKENKLTADSPIEKKCFIGIAFVAASCESNKDDMLNNMDILKSSPDSRLCSAIEQVKKSSPNIEEPKTSDESAFDESSKYKKRKTRNEPTLLLPGRRLTRSQTRKLEEDTVKQGNSSKKLDFEQKTQERDEISTGQNTDIQFETAAQSLSHQNSKNGQHSETDIPLAKDLKAAQEEAGVSTAKENVCKEIESLESEFSNDSFPRLPSKRVKLLSTDEDSDDNLIIDENVSGADDKQKDDVSHLQTESINIQNAPNEFNIIQSEKTQPVSINTTGSENNKLSSGDKKDIGSTLDQILHLQEEMLKPRKKLLHTVMEQRPQTPSGPQPGLPTYLEDASQFPSLDPSLNANAQYSLWNMGQFKVIMRSRLHSRQLSSIPCFIFSKLEYQSQFGGEICSEHELLYQWFTLLCHPGSVGLRVRIDARTSKVLMTEHLTLPDMHNLVAKLSPEKPLCWIMDVFEKLKGLPNGQYLLGHQRKEEVLTLYAATDGNKRGDFDLHTAIRQRLVALDDGNTGWQSQDSEIEVPWHPIDPDVMLPSLVSINRIPATFPPGKRSETLPKQKKKSPKKKSKKKSKITKMKEKLQQN